MQMGVHTLTGLPYKVYNGRICVSKTCKHIACFAHG
jgi:hypothetical protein